MIYTWYIKLEGEIFMPSNPLFIICLLIIMFIAISLLSEPLLNKTSRDKIGKKLENYYDTNKTNEKESGK